MLFSFEYNDMEWKKFIGDKLLSIYGVDVSEDLKGFPSHIEMPTLCSTFYYVMLMSKIPTQCLLVVIPEDVQQSYVGVFTPDGFEYIPLMEQSKWLVSYPCFMVWEAKNYMAYGRIDMV